jgi:hypothetical protein
MLSPALIVKPKSLYVAECYQNFEYTKTGKILRKLKIPKLRWKDEFWNIVVTAGLNKLLDATIKSGLASPAWYVGLKGTGSMVAGDTMGSHSGWSEIAPYSNANRPTYTPGSISGGSVDNSASKAVFNINGSSTVYGCFLTDNNTVSGSSGTLYGGGDFGASRAVINGDTLNITITLTQVTG